MAKVMLAKLTSKGQMTIPQEFRSRLKLGAGDYVVLRPALGGIFISKASVQPEADAEAALRQLASEVLASPVEEESSTASPSIDSADAQEESTRKSLPEDAQRRIAELTLAYLGRKLEQHPEDSDTELDSDGIAQAIADHYGTDDILEIIDGVRGRGGS